MAESDSDEDKPVAALVAARKIAQGNGTPNGIKSGSSGSQTATTTAAGNASDSEEDLTIVDLIRKRQKEGRLSELSKKKKASEAAEVSSSSKKAKTESSDNNTKALVRQYGGGNSASAEFYSTKKGFLVQTFLQRWWYAVQWPRPEETGEPPAGYEPLDGFPGVFVSTRTDSLGNILDLRDKTNCPCLANYAKRSSAELKQLCITALEGQKNALLDAEGEDNARKLLFALKTTLGEVKKIDADAADREARKFENAFGKDNGKKIKQESK